NITINDEPISEAEPSITIISPSVDVFHDTPAPQDRWSREKHILLVNILGEPQAGVTTRSRVRDSKVASAYECLYVNFLFEIEPKKVTKAIEEEGWWFFRIKMDENGVVIRNKERLVTQGYIQEEGINYDETFTQVARLESIKIFLTYAAYIADWASVKCPMLLPNNMGHDESRVSINETQFGGMIGSLMYLIARDMISNSPHVSMVGLWYPKGSGFDLKAYSYSDYAGCNLDRKSTSRVCQILRGKLVCLSVKKQSIVAMSSVEAEYVVATGCSEPSFIRLVAELGMLNIDKVDPDKAKVLKAKSFISKSSSQQTKTQVTLALDVTFKCDKGIIAFNNGIALLEHSNTLYLSMLSFLSYCYVYTALTKQPSTFDSEYLRKFWYSAEVDATNAITFTLSNFDKPLSFNRDDFSSNTGLKYIENYVSTPTKETDHCATLQPVGQSKASIDKRSKKKKNPSSSKPKTSKIVKESQSEKLVTNTQHVKESVATTDAIKSREAFKSKEELRNQPKPVDAEKNFCLDHKLDDLRKFFDYQSLRKCISLSMSYEGMNTMVYLLMNGRDVIVVVHTLHNTTCRS
nr:hypothetical protein [Tanacetum cinerariifolium]